jgi:molybdopterin-guanine dinucleotide biosynthesis protein
VDCADWKTHRDQADNPRFKRKFDKWKTETFANSSFLIQSLMHPISRLRMETHIALIRLNELPSGFRVLSADLMLIEGLPDDSKKIIRKIILHYQTKEPEKVYCTTMFEVEAINADNNCYISEVYILGEDSNLAVIQDAARHLLKMVVVWNL